MTSAMKPADRRARNEELLQDGNVRAFLRTIRFCEGTADDDGYRRLFGGVLIDDLTRHPNLKQTYKLSKGGELTSTAAGAYQFLFSTWEWCLTRLGLKDFGRVSQDLAAVELLFRRSAVEDIVAGRLPDAVRKCALEWASLPGSPYGQPVKSYDQVAAEYEKHGGKLFPQGKVQIQREEAEQVAPWLLSAVKVGLTETIPALVNIFGSGSETSQKNAKAVEAVAEIVKTSIGAKNEQEMLDLLKTSPEAQQVARKAVEEQYYQLSEMYAGSVAAAKAFDLKVMTSDGPWWQLIKSPSFVMGLLLLGPVYIIVLSLVGVLGSAEWSPEVRASIAGLITGTVIGGLVGYYYGTSTSRNRTTSPTQPGGVAN